MKVYKQNFMDENINFHKINFIPKIMIARRDIHVHHGLQ